MADYLLLAVAMMVLGFSLRWCLLHNPSKKVELLSFTMIPVLILNTEYYYKPSKTWISFLEIKHDFKFLLALLSATDSGVERVFKNILTNHIISQKLMLIWS